MHCGFGGNKIIFVQKKTHVMRRYTYLTLFTSISILICDQRQPLLKSLTSRPVPMSNASIMWLERVMLAISSILLSMQESFDRAIGSKISMIWNTILVGTDVICPHNNHNDQVNAD